MIAAKLFKSHKMTSNKRGLSEVVATVLTIMITILAISVIAGFVVPFVKNNLQKSTECMDYRSYYMFDDSFGYNCNNAGKYEISVKAGMDVQLSQNVGSMKIVLTDSGGKTKVIDITNGLESSSDAGGLEMMGKPGESIKLPSPGGTITYGYNALPEEKFVGAEVYPVLKSGRICADIKESINIISCD